LQKLNPLAETVRNTKGVFLNCVEKILHQWEKSDLTQSLCVGTHQDKI